MKLTDMVSQSTFLKMEQSSSSFIDKYDWELAIVKNVIFWLIMTDPWTFMQLQSHQIRWAPNRYCANMRKTQSKCQNGQGAISDLDTFAFVRLTLPDCKLWSATCKPKFQSWAMKFADTAFQMTDCPWKVVWRNSHTPTTCSPYKNGVFAQLIKEQSLKCRL